MEEDDLFGDLQGFTPSVRPSSRPSTSSHSFPLDPALAGPSSDNLFHTQDQYADDDDDEAYWHDDDERDGDSFGGSQGGQPGDEEDESDETDAEEEFAAVQRGETGGVKRAMKNQGGLAGEGDGASSSNAKGKQRAADLDATGGGFGGDDDEEEGTGEEIKCVPCPSFFLREKTELTGEENRSRFITAMRDSSSTGIGGLSALDKEFDKSIAYELDGFDPDLIEDMAVGIKGRKRKKGGGVRSFPRSGSLLHIDVLLLHRPVVELPPTLNPLPKSSVSSAKPTTPTRRDDSRKPSSSSPRSFVSIQSSVRVGTPLRRSTKNWRTGRRRFSVRL
jgi:general transcription factor 3C polypeptide 3 (transcription factor C subunit 4)